MIFLIFLCRYEYNRPFLEAKDYQDDDALAVEATGYALLTMFMVEGGGVTIIQDQIVQWLNTMRLGDGGFISTVDTVFFFVFIKMTTNQGLQGIVISWIGPVNLMWDFIFFCNLRLLI